MEDTFVMANALRLFFILTSPVIFLVGVFLLYDVDTYMKIEKFLSRSYGAPKRTFLKMLEENRESFQVFLLRKRRFIGIVCLLNSLLAIIISSTLLKK